MNFALRGGAEQRNLRRPGFQLQITVEIDSSGVKYLQYREDKQSKTNQGRLSSKHSQCKEAKVYGSDNPLQDIVCLYKKYINLLPVNGKQLSLYKYPLKRPQPNVWYSDAQLGVNALQKIMKTLYSKAGLSGEKFCNHSLQATCTTRMYQAGVDEQVIKKFTGHASEVVRKYKTTSDDLLKLANKTVSGNDFELPKKRPVSATVSKAPEEELPCQIPSLEASVQPKHERVAKRSVCQYFASQNCKDMCKVLHKIDEKLDKKWLKKVKFSVKYEC